MKGRAKADTLSSSAVTVLLVLAMILAGLLACQRGVVRFPHREHLGLKCGGEDEPECLSCLACHGQIVKEAAKGHPASQDCSRCHKNSHRIARVLSAPASPAREQAEQISFDHGLHLQLDAIGGQCITCHGGVVSETEKPHFPEMARCFACHEHKSQWDRGECVPCHRMADLKGLFPRTFLRHGPGWDRGHAAAALATTVQCQACHTAESCDDCHDVTQGLRVEIRQAEQVHRDFIHPADFLTRHAMEASSEPARCLSCHRTETCDSCHLARGVSAGRLGADNPHPPGWMGPDSADARHHGRAARRELLSCASCHDQGPMTNCIDCHRVGGPGGNPHPEGWRSSRTPSEVMCAYCHEGP